MPEHYLKCVWVYMLVGLSVHVIFYCSNFAIFYFGKQSTFWLFPFINLFWENKGIRRKLISLHVNVRKYNTTISSYVHIMAILIMTPFMAWLIYLLREKGKTLPFFFLLKPVFTFYIQQLFKRPWALPLTFPYLHLKTERLYA